MIETPVIVQSEEQQAAVIHVTVPRDRIQEVMGPGIEEVMKTVTAQGLQITGPWYTYHHRMVPDVFDFEIGVPISSPVKPEGRVVPGRLPARRVARTVYQGPYEGLGEAWGEFGAWIAEQGLEPAEDLWEIYVAGPESGSDASGFRTELNHPLID